MAFCVRPSGNLRDTRIRRITPLASKTICRTTVPCTRLILAISVYCAFSLYKMVGLWLAVVVGIFLFAGGGGWEFAGGSVGSCRCCEAVLSAGKRSDRYIARFWLCS